MKKEKSKMLSKASESLRRRKATKRQFYFSIISLFIACAIFVTGTVSWFSISTAKLDAGRFMLECGKGLRVNDSGESDFQFNNVDKEIVPASSVNGRNLFFPADGSDFSKVTDEITYRSATVGDKNVNYIQIDFTLTAQENNTALYLNTDDDATKLSVYDSDKDQDSVTLAAPLRLAIWAGTEKDNTAPNEPIVFNPTGRTFYTAAVNTVDRSSGRLLSKKAQLSHAFEDYSYGGTPVAVLSKGVETKFSIIIWLEGADPKCVYDQVISKKNIKLSIAFSTSWDKTQVVRFKDETGGNGQAGWVKNLITNGVTVGGKTVKYTPYLHYKKHGSSSSDDVTDFQMWAYDNTDDSLATEWACNMPGDMSNEVSFELRPSDSSLPTYKFTQDTNGNSTLDRGVNRLYTADDTTQPNAQDITDASYSQCTGHWVALGDSDGGGSDIGELEGDDF